MWYSSSTLPQTIVTLGRLNLIGGTACGHRFLAAKTRWVIFDKFYSRQKRKGMMDAPFLVKIDCPFICQTAILSPLLLWWLSEIIEDKVAFTHFNAAGKIRNVDLKF